MMGLLGRRGGGGGNGNGTRGGRGKPPTVPKLFVCPILLDIMTDPTTTSCGHMFEREAIVNWIHTVSCTL